MQVKHKTFGLDFEIPEILQGDMEKYEKTLQPMIEGVGGIEIAVYSGAVVRAAIKVGWLPSEITEETIGKWKPGKVSYVTGKITEAIHEARTIPQD